MSMTDMVQFNGVEYISSKKASELSGYTQDYIGQLARAGKIDVRRVAGLWYVRYESLEAYKLESDSVNQVSPVREVETHPTSLVFFDGKEYISASEAAKTTGYHQDYVGQLARGGKIPARQVGTRWYVGRTGILEHKRQKDEMLGAVQVSSVGLGYKKEVIADNQVPVSRYFPDSSDLLPSLVTPKEPVSVHTPQVANSVGRVQLPIRVIAPKNEKVLSSRKSKKLVKYRYIAPIATVIIIFSLGVYTFENDAVLTDSFKKDNVGSSMVASVAAETSSFLDYLEKILTTERVYVR